MSSDILLKDIKRPTIGSLALSLMSKVPETLNPIEQMQENLTDYDKNLFECLEIHKKIYPEDFYIVVITKQERIAHNIMRNYFFARLSCPTPDYDQILYKYTLKNNHIDFLWVIPSRDACFHLLQHRAEVSPSEYGLLEFVLKFNDGTLFEVAKTLNNEDDAMEERKKILLASN